MAKLKGKKLQKAAATSIEEEETVSYVVRGGLSLNTYSGVKCAGEAIVPEDLVSTRYSASDTELCLAKKKFEYLIGKGYLVKAE